MTEQYDPNTIEQKWQRVWADAQAYVVANPAEPARDGDAQELRARAAAVPVRKPPPRAPARLHDRRRRHPLPAAQRLPACCTRWASTRSASLPRTPRSARVVTRARSPSGTSQSITRSMQRMGWWIDWSRELSTHRPRLLPLAAVAVPEVPRARPRLSQGSAGQVVPQRPDGARQRAGAAGRDLRALRRRGRVARDGAVVLQDHRLRAGAARRSRDRRLARVDQGSPAELDRAVRGRRAQLPDRRVGRGDSRLHDPSGHALRRDLLRARAGARARRADRLRRGEGVRPPDRGARRRRSAPPRRRRPASSLGCTPSTRSTASGSRSMSPTTS